MMALTFELNGSANKELFKSMIKEMVSRFAPAATLASTI
jgi:hypothetical protein